MTDSFNVKLTSESDSLLANWPTDVPFFYFKYDNSKVIIPTRFHRIGIEDLKSVRLNEPTREHPVVGCLPYGFDQASERCILFRVEEALTTAPHIARRTDNVQLTPLDPNHQSKIEQVIRDIKKGRYYQLNLLRFFQATIAEPVEEFLIQSVFDKGGAHSGIYMDSQRLIASLSPERFVTWRMIEDRLQIETFPVKGTIAAELDDSLLSDPKVKAELNIIVDLLRNDLFSICEPHSVKVVSSDRIMRTHYVKHRYAHLSGAIRRDLTLYEVLRGLLPAGSITGAPKIEVVKAISEYESNDRGYSMGNFFYFNPRDCSFDSSVSIRTFQFDRRTRACSYAAGGGITIKSDPEKEIEEIWAKCRVL